MNTNRHESRTTAPAQQITLRGPAELADALPFVLGFHPTDSVVLVALHGEHGRFGGRVRLGIPGSPEEWPATAEGLAECLVEGSGRVGSRPDGIVVFLCQDPAPGETGRRVMERLRPFAQRLRTACGALDIPVYEALCISDGLYFSYCCPDVRCCPTDGTPLALTGTSVMAATATYAGIQVRGSLKDMQARLKPHGSPDDEPQRQALNSAAAVIVPRILDAPTGQGRTEVREATLELAGELLRRFAPPAGGAAVPGAAGAAGEAREADSSAGRFRLGTAAADTADDGLLTHDEAAALILGLQDRETRDRAAEWMEGAEGAAALRLWRALARRCVTPFQEHAAAPLALAGWAAWSTGDEPAARVALGLALDADPDYLFARLLHQACNEGLDPESLRSCLRGERRARAEAETPVPAGAPGAAESGSAAAADGREGEHRGSEETPSPSEGRTARRRVRQRNAPPRGPRQAGPPAGTGPGVSLVKSARGTGARRGGQRGTRSGR
ncbi:DUF4192 domain-containing protein [Streptomyces sp. ms191]|uniref:DUF4192 domain-containing protein n=1 Tax=Streptomyces sp. ms191 TaxID=1827978 RepID=UPI0011CDFC42|nr:DUF4192 domain-containing protein [Streptomyces sp. ms191]TXS31780.1 DUF4192 domain-containing protein [Streptomyces sp. ms191]